ncbi:hypothetical protein AMATHDRAFT_70337 [Amanita thiersii Skay4041]|uniref:ER membrane protein complex subunit 1 n=1 Tax=Amanita thiersii Skay4041 TaxID=703135 RepID=A0A2A9NEP0_9AGAR|nr:hypothetical protein AMATHDRAFT_70337 [Amanita thiersii Skay4041]
MWQLSALHAFLLFSLSPAVWALHESDVGVVDWYKQLVGVPLSGSVDTSPVFHHGIENSTEGLLLTATTGNVLAALFPTNGSVAWRFLFQPEDRIAGFYRDGNVVTTLSGPGGSTLRSFEALTGHLVSEQRLHDPSKGRPSEPPHFGKSVTYAIQDESSAESRGPYILTNGCTVSRIDETTGNAIWSWTSPNPSSVVYTKLMHTPYATYAIGVTSSFGSYTLHITALSSSTGEVLNEVEVPSSIKAPVNDLILLARQTTERYRPRIVWLERDSGLVKSKALTPDLKNPPASSKGLSCERIMDVGLSSLGYFVAVEKSRHAAWVTKILEDGTQIRGLYEFTKLKAEDAPEAVYTGGTDKDGNILVGRVSWSRRVGKAVMDIFAPHISERSQRFYFNFDTDSHGLISHATLTTTPSPHLIITTSTGSVQSWSFPVPTTQDSSSNQTQSRPDGEVTWIREEGLTAISATDFVELPERTTDSVGREGEGFVGRVMRQLVEARNFPQYITNFIIRFTTGSYPSLVPPSAMRSSSSGSANATVSPMVRDPFGFRQLIIVATHLGKVYALDSASGEVVWSRVLGLGWAGEESGEKRIVVGGRVVVVKVFVVGEEEGKPEVVFVAHRKAANGLLDTVLFHVDAMTGVDAREGTEEDKGEDNKGPLEGTDAISGQLVETYLLKKKKKIVVMLDDFLQVYLYPENDETRKIFSRAASSLSFPLRVGLPVDQMVPGGEPIRPRQRIVGHGVELNKDLSDRYVAYARWTLNLPPDEDIQTFVPASKGPIASLGKVMGNKTTLYKYLNGNMFGVLTAPSPANQDSTTSESKAVPTCGIYVVDGVKGTIIYRAAVPAWTGSPQGVGKVCNVKMSLTENWLVYHYYDEDMGSGTAAKGQTKGWRIVSVEMYEGLTDEKFKSSDMGAYNKEMANVTVIEQAYVFPYGVSALATTSTKFGITSKDLIVATLNGRIQSFPRRMLDPRRPNRKPTNVELEEMLVQYDPLLPDDPKRVLSHNYQTANIQRIVTSPALLESTSLVFAYGLDLFLTRVSPSGTFDVLSESFNKAQLVFTVSGLVLAIVVTRPMVKRKMLQQKWYR